MLMDGKLIRAIALISLSAGALPVGLMPSWPVARLKTSACLADLARRDPEADVRQDLMRGEDRFFVKAHYGFGAGLDMPGLQNCGPEPSVDASGSFNLSGNYVLRPLLYPDDFQGPLEQPCCDFDYTYTKCGEKQLEYYIKYNVYLAKMHPQSRHKYC